MSVFKNFRNLFFILLLIFISFKFQDFYLDRKYEIQINSIPLKDLQVIMQVIDVAKSKIGLEYTWGGKGEIMTENKLNQLIEYYGHEYYPLTKDDYIGIQAFDCSGLVYYSYLKVCNIDIGLSTKHQVEVLEDFKVSYKDIQPGDLIFTPGHVVMYIGKNEVIQAKGKSAYPNGGIVKTSAFLYKNGDVYRPIDYINNINNSY